MRNIYLIAAIIGFVLPNILVFQESLATGNWLLYVDPLATIKGMFANRIASVFMLDLLWVLLVFLGWTWVVSKREGITRIWLIWGLTLLFGLGGGFPLFLYWRETASRNA
ncbi:MAG: DUF2834 domain-containing protein [Bacteroidota bacterium]